MRTLVHILVCAVALILCPASVQAENSCVAPYRTAELRPDSFRPDARQDEDWLLVALGAVIIFITGWLIGKPNKRALLIDIDKAFGNRVTEATIHGKRLRWNKPIVAAHKAVKAAVNKHL